VRYREGITEDQNIMSKGRYEYAVAQLLGGARSQGQFEKVKVYETLDKVQDYKKKDPKDEIEMENSDRLKKFIRKRQQRTTDIKL
jgi:pyruvate-formate lyase